MLNIDFEYRKGVLFLRLKGVLNKSTSFVLDEALKNICDRAGVRFLLINFEKLSSIDKNGINTIINSYNKYFKDRGKLMACGFNNRLITDIKESSLLSYVSIVKNEMSVFNVVNI